MAQSLRLKERAVFNKQEAVEEALELIAIFDEMGAVGCRGGAKQIRHQLLAHLENAGWSKPVTIAPLESKITITSRKNECGLCVQLGNTARGYADMLKLQALYVDTSISNAVMIVPDNYVSKTLGDNILSSDRLERELEVFSKVITVPLVLLEISNTF